MCARTTVTFGFGNQKVVFGERAEEGETAPCSLRVRNELCFAAEREQTVSLHYCDFSCFNNQKVVLAEHSEERRFAGP